MLSRYSVKRPLTVIMIVILVIILGVISFTNMTTDLLPNMDFPYVVMYTSFPGASPEKIETMVTKPLESAVSTLSGIESVQSVSYENVSLIIIEFSYGVNMDSVLIELSSRVDLVKASLDSNVGTPVYMKINPDMLPVMVLSAGVRDMDEIAASDFVTKNVVPAIERVNGVATVSTAGLLKEEIRVTLSSSKIDALNDRILGAVDSELLEVQKQLRDARKELEEKKKQFETESKSQLDELNSAESAVADGYAQINEGYAQLDATYASLTAQLNELKTKRAQLVDLIDGVNNMETLENMLRLAEAAVSEAEKALEFAKNEIAKLESRLSALQAQLDELEDTPENAEARAELIAQIEELESQIAFANAALSIAQSRFEELKAQYEALKAQYEALTAALDALGNPEVAELESMLAQVDNGIAQIEDGLNQVAAARAELDAAKAELDENSQQVSSGKASLQSMLHSAAKQISDAEAELEKAEADFEAARDEAYAKANIDGVITPSMLNGILLADNFSLPAGYSYDGDIRYPVKVGDPFTDVGEIASLELFTLPIDGFEPIRIDDIADVQITNNAGESYVRLNGNNAIMITVDKQSNYSTSAVSKSIQKALNKLEGEYESLELAVLMNQGVYIDIVIKSVISNLLLGGALAIVILFLFLRSGRATFIVAASIPISLTLAVVLMYFTKVNLNVLSLAGLALGVGMLVDNSIIAIENIYRLRLEGIPAAKAAVQGAKQISGSVFASTLTTVCVFLPIVFTDGITKQLFSDMGLTIAYSLLASLIVALTLVPALSSTMLKNKTHKQSRYHDKFRDAYGHALSFSLKHKWIVFAGVSLLLVLSIVCALTMGTEFIPDSDFSEIMVTVSVDSDVTTEQAREIADTLTDRILAMESVNSVGVSQGSSSGLSLDSSNGLSMYVVLNDKRKVTSMEVSENIVAAASDLDCAVSANTVISRMTSFLGSGIELEIRGDSIDELKRIATDVAAELESIPGTYNVSSGVENAAVELKVVIDKNSALKYGLTVAQVYQQLSAELSSESAATTVTLDDKDYPVIVAKDEKMQISYDKLMDCGLVGTENGEEIKLKLSDIATLSEEIGLPSIHRNNYVHYISVTASVDESHNAGKISRQIEGFISDYDLPDGYTISEKGENKLVSDAINDVVLMIALAIVLIYAIMAAQFQSLLSPFIVMFTIPLAFTGGILLLWICGFNLSIIALLGMLILVGVVVNNGIVFIDFTNRLRKDGMERQDALIEAGKTRMRPILMTALTTILGLMTMLFGLGTGTDMLQPMAAVMIGGLTYATALTMFVVPLLYDIMCKKPPKVVDVGDSKEE